MPASILYPIGKALMSLDIEGTDDNSQLKANQHEILCRGSRQYCLDKRQEILERRGLAVPETWDLQWNSSTGAKWHPGLLDDPDLLLWCTMDNAHLDTYFDDPKTRASKLKDRSGYGHDFDEVSGSGPEVDKALQNGFQGLKFTGTGGSTGEYLKHTEDANDLFDVGLGEFCCFLAFEEGDNNGVREYIFTNGNPVDWGIEKDFRFSKRGFDSLIQNVATEVDESWVSTKHTMQCGRKAGDGVTRVDGSTGSALTVSSTIENKNLTNAQGMFIGRKSAAAANYWGGTLYEILFFKTWPTDSLRNKIEGYLAHKYNIENIFPAGHPYKAEPPRQVVA